MRSAILAAAIAVFTAWVPSSPPSDAATATCPGTSLSVTAPHGATAPALVPVMQATVDHVRGDALWILGSQRDDGSIALVPGGTIRPYMANYAAMGLAAAAVRTGETVYAGGAWQWLQWYAAHEDSNGYVTDEDGTMDSTDAYAGTFLLAARADGDRHTLACQGQRARTAEALGRRRHQRCPSG